MAVRITIPVQASEPNGGSATFDIDESLDTVIAKLTPDEPPKDAEQYRKNLTFQKVGGGSVFISMPQSGFWVDEIT